MNGRIGQTTFGLPVPQGSWIREDVTWDATVPSGETFAFELRSGYGTGTTVDNFIEKFYGFGWNEISLTGPLVDARQTDTPIGYKFEADAPVGTYDCLTLVGYVDGETYYYFDWKIDPNVITIEPGLGASIVSTSFVKV